MQSTSNQKDRRELGAFGKKNSLGMERRPMKVLIRLGSAICTGFGLCVYLLVYTYIYIYLLVYVCMYSAHTFLRSQYIYIYMYMYVYTYIYKYK